MYGVSALSPVIEQPTLIGACAVCEIKDAQEAGYLETQELTPDPKGYLKIVNMAQSKRLRKT